MVEKEMDEYGASDDSDKNDGTKEDARSYTKARKDDIIARGTDKTKSYQSSSYQPPGYTSFGYPSSGYQSSNYQPLDYAYFGYPSSGYQSSNYQPPGYTSFDYPSSDYQSPYYTSIDYYSCQPLAVSSLAINPLAVSSEPSRMDRSRMPPDGPGSEKPAPAEYRVNTSLSAATAIRKLSYWESEIPEGKVRVRWKCTCGQSLFDDFTELEQGAAQRLEDHLNHRFNDSDRSVRSRISFKSFSSTASTSMNSLKKAFGWKETELPQHELQSDATERPNSPPAPPREPLFLLLCQNEGVYAKKLLQLSVSDLQSDKKLFAVLRTNYTRMRSRWWWSSLLSFRTLTGIKFVKFELYKSSSLIDIRERDAIPPPDAIFGHHRDYRYAPAPPDMIPPVGENHLMHLFQHPQHAEDEPVCLERFPKKLRERLAVRAEASTGFGWGLSLEEGWDRRKTWVVGFGIFVLGSSLWGVLWTVFERSVQDAFAVAAYMVSFAVVTVGFVQAVVGG